VASWHLVAEVCYTFVKYVQPCHQWVLTMSGKSLVETIFVFIDIETLGEYQSHFQLLCNIFRSHNPSAKPLTNCPKSIRTSSKFHLEQIMPLGTFLLHLPNCFHIRILRSTQWTFHPLRCLLFTFAIQWCNVETTLVEAVFAEEMNRWKVERYAAGRAARRVEG
jgi:hypothetical protein